ncbi:MAG: hypothetical protein ACPGEG_04750, partial [Salibacteraceae bacterium]
MKGASLFLTLFFITTNLCAQDWKVIGELDYAAESLMSDEKSDLLYIGGAFETINGRQFYRIATWNGQQWSGLDYGVHYDSVSWGGGVSQITNYNDKLIVVGSFNHVGYYQKSKNIALWNTDSLKWETMNWNPNEAVYYVLQQNDTTFVLGGYDSIGGVAIRGTSYLYQNQWTNMSPPDGAEIPKVLVPYQNSYYLGGNMNGSIPGVNDIARWDGLKFHPVGTGVSGGLGHVH